MSKISVNERCGDKPALGVYPDYVEQACGSFCDGCHWKSSASHHQESFSRQGSVVCMSAYPTGTGDLPVFYHTLHISVLGTQYP